MKAKVLKQFTMINIILATLTSVSYFLEPVILTISVVAFSALLLVLNIVAGKIVVSVYRMRKIRSYPDEFPGRYYSVLSHRRFAITSGLKPFKNRVFISESFWRSKLPLRSRAFIIAHEYYHWNGAHGYWSAFGVFMVLMFATSTSLSFVPWFIVIPPTIVGNALMVFIYANLKRRLEDEADMMAMVAVNASKEEISKALDFFGDNPGLFHRTNRERLYLIFNEGLTNDF